jgi:hypothetical protein
MTLLPSRIGGTVTQEVAYFDATPDTIADWLRDGLGGAWKERTRGWSSLQDATRDLSPAVPLSRYAIVPNGSWTLMLNNGPLGTDVGLLPSQAARELGCAAIRAVCVQDDEPGYAARILEVYGPRGEAPLRSLRSIVAANDGGKWVFETTGEPLPFERTDLYLRHPLSERLTPTTLYDYLRELDVPIDSEPDWGGTIVVERQR